MAELTAVNLGSQKTSQYNPLNFFRVEIQFSVSEAFGITLLLLKVRVSFIHANVHFYCIFV